jgi:chemotaxis protein histidine kinase CheA
MHLVRRTLAHDLEAPAEPQAAEGRLLLSDWHDLISSVIQVRDDRRGIDPEKNLRKARANDLVAHDAALNQADRLNLIFKPALSAARQISDLSRRGVGLLDVAALAARVHEGRESARQTLALPSPTHHSTHATH